MHPLITQSLEHLSVGELNNSFSLVKQYALEKRMSGLSDKLNQLEQNYNYLLKYLSDGMPDPSREKLYSSIRYKLYALLKNIEMDEDSKTSSLLYFSFKRTSEYTSLTFGDALGRFISADSALQLTDIYDSSSNITEEAKKLMAEKDRAVKDIFTVVWTMPLGEKNQLDAVVNVASDVDISYQIRAIIVSALTFSLLQRYDPSQLISLITIDSRSGDQRIKARALIGIVIALCKYTETFGPDKELDLRFSTWLDDLSNYTRLRDVIYALVKTRGSEKLTSKINQEIMPGFAAISKDLLKDIQKREKPLSLEELQENPEWEKALRESGLDKKLHKLHNLYDKGADMMLPMFRQLSNHYFFRDIDNWFRPFDLWEAERLGVDKKLASAINATPPSMILCDSDKFAMLINLSRIQGSSMNLMTDALKMGHEEMQEDFKDMENKISNPVFNIEVVNYMRTLFRFFKYFRLQNEFFDPFDKAISFNKLPYIGALLSEEEIQRTIAETYFNQGYYKDAALIYKSISSFHPKDESLIYQKIGYCYEKDNIPKYALHYYIKAEDLKGSDDIWLLERIFHLSKDLGKNEKLIESLDRLIKSDSENAFYLREWIKAVHNEHVYTSHPDLVPLYENRISKLLYIDPDNNDNISLKAASLAAKDKWDDVAELLKSRLSDIEMYLAAASLGKHEDSPKSDRESEKAMIEDLLLLTSAYSANEEYANAIFMLKNILMINPDCSVKYLTEYLENLWRDSDSLSDRLIMIPMLIEASR